MTAANATHTAELGCNRDPVDRDVRLDDINRLRAAMERVLGHAAAERNPMFIRSSVRREYMVNRPLDNCSMLAKAGVIAMAPVDYTMPVKTSRRFISDRSVI